MPQGRPYRRVLLTVSHSVEALFELSLTVMDQGMPSQGLEDRRARSAQGNLWKGVDEPPGYRLCRASRARASFPGRSGPTACPGLRALASAFEADTDRADAALLCRLCREFIRPYLLSMRVSLIRAQLLEETPFLLNDGTFSRHRSYFQMHC